MNLYETIYILKPDMEEEAIKATVEKFKNIIEENGEMDTLDEWGKRKLAYPIQFFKEGYYVYMKFKANSNLPKELDRVFGITEDVIRHLIVRIDK